LKKNNSPAKVTVRWIIKIRLKNIELEQKEHFFGDKKKKRALEMASLLNEKKKLRTERTHCIKKFQNHEKERKDFH